MSVASQDKEEIVIRDLDLDLITQVRNDWQFYRDRRPDSYTKIRRRNPGRRSRMTTLITNGTVVSATGSSAQDVLIDGETIAALLAPGSQLLGDLAGSAQTRSSTRPASTSSPAASTATPTWRCRSAAPTPRDTFETGTRAAAWGGTTTIVDFVVQAHGQRVQDQVALWHDKAGGNCAIDYGFHQIIGEVNDESLKAMDELVGEGVTQLQAVHGLPRASSCPPTARSCRPCRRRPATAR